MFMYWWIYCSDLTAFHDLALHIAMDSDAEIVLPRAEKYFNLWVPVLG